MKKAAPAPVAKGVTGNTFALADRIHGQLNDARLGSLAGKISGAELQQFANSPNALRLFDNRTSHINIIQKIDGKLIRITVPRDEMKIISVGSIRENQVNNLIKKGDFTPLNRGN